MKSGLAKIVLTAILTMAIGSAAIATASNSHSRKYFTIEGKVLQVDTKAQTILVADNQSDKLYLVSVPVEGSFKITSGLYRLYDSPDVEHVFKNDVVKVRCLANDSGRYARLEGDRDAVIVVAN